ncbi:TPA_asm: transcriptional regulator [Salmonella enterica subsp. houtenae serovar 45:g,z51:-]|uniref:Transcriptional regulator n=1 Tax=Salmonella enterica subsp. houtenae serovar 45:g,z51:- TaxID=1967611 RepID=A0A736R8W7_SALHO|nr:transcriptional regulator [Salmonella enterica subsp. houtenae str. CFSAN000557]HAE7765368.1 transcriptional regulator [Salmonella enterica subsp. houtenae serovar 45:g,z51:-]
MRNKSDWPPADIKAALEKANTNLSRLSRENDLRPRTLGNALRAPYLRGEAIIAKAIGEKPEAIWPTRYEKRARRGYVGCND